MTWDEAVAYALTLPDTVLGTSYCQPAVMANGRAMLSSGHEEGSFALHIDEGLKDILLATDPASFWQTRHYEGWPVILVRHASPDSARIREIIARARDWAMTRARPKPRPAR